jgi:hypothetical protein
MNLLTYMNKKKAVTFEQQPFNLSGGGWGSNPRPSDPQSDALTY